jgi:hypothetical protein
MSTIDWIIAGLLGLGLLGCLLKGAPEGYEDKDGFHYGKPPTKEQDEDR